MRAGLDFIFAIVRALPPWAEFAIVITGAFGWFIFLSLGLALDAPGAILTSGSEFAELVIFELAVGAPLLLFLSLRGWRFADLGFDRPRKEDAGHAIVLLAAAYAGTLTLWYFMPPATRETMAFEGFIVEDGISLPLALCLSLVNGAFEEIFVCAYVLSAWRGKSMWTAISASAGIRVVYHLYQGPLAVVSIGPLGLVFAWYCATRGRVWPLIAAHALADFVPLLPYVNV